MVGVACAAALVSACGGGDGDGTGPGTTEPGFRMVVTGPAGERFTLEGEESSWASDEDAVWANLWSQVGSPSIDPPVHVFLDVVWPIARPDDMRGTYLSPPSAGAGNPALQVSTIQYLIVQDSLRLVITRADDLLLEGQFSGVLRQYRPDPAGDRFTVSGRFRVPRQEP